MKKFFYKLRRKKKEGGFTLWNRPLAPLRDSTGFTLLEMVVAVSILVGAVMGPIIVAVNGINAAVGAKNRNLANYLAMEVIEVLKNRQLTNFINNRTFTSGITGTDSANYSDSSPGGSCLGSNNKCRVDVWGVDGSKVVVSPCPSGDCSLQNYTVGNETKYTHTGGTPSPNNLKRYFYVDNTVPDQLKVIVIVDWEEKGVPKSVKLEDYLQNWGES